MQVTRVAPDWPVPSLMHRRRVMVDRITYVGLDVHKEGIVVAVAEGGIRGEVRGYGRIANTAGALDRLMRKLGGEGVGLRFCYEAGPCGYGIQRHLSAHGHECVVVAPSLIPKRAGDRVKTDRRDAASLARLHRAGELTAVWVPDVGHEAMRDLVRARLDAVHSLRRAPAALRVLAASWMPLWPAGLDQAASPVAGRAQVRAGGPSHRAGRLRCGGRGRRGAAQPADGADRGNAAGLDIGSRGGGIADNAGHGAGQCGELDRRTGRSLAFCQSTPADGLSRAGAVRTLER